MRKIASLAVCFAFLSVGYLQAAEVSFIELKGHTDSVNCVALSSDGKKIVTGSDDGTARIWDVESKKEIQMLAGHTNRDTAFSPDGKKFVMAHVDHAARIWDVESNKELQKLG